MKPFAFFIRVLNPSKPGYEKSQILESILREICTNLDLELIDASDVNRTGMISTQILRALRDADVVFADANTSNENIWYEIGYTHSMNLEKVMYFFEEGRVLPFDIHGLRGISYNLAKIANRKFHDEIVQMLNHILSHGALDRLLRNEHYNSATLEYISIRPQLKESFINHLKSASLNIDNSPELRRRAIDVLLSLGFLDDEISERLSNPLVEEHIRQMLFDKLSRIDFPPSTQVWLNGLAEKLRHPVLRDLARAATHHFIIGNIDKDFFYDKFVRHENWVVRKHLTINLLRNLQSSGIPMLKVLLTDRKEEVSNRFVEWFNDNKNKQDFSDLELAILEEIKTVWASSIISSHKEVAEQIEQVIK